MPKTRIRGPRRATYSRFIALYGRVYPCFLSPKLTRIFRNPSNRRVFVTYQQRDLPVDTRSVRSLQPESLVILRGRSVFHSVCTTTPGAQRPRTLFRLRVIVPFSLCFAGTEKKHRLPTRTPRRHRIDVFQSRRPLLPTRSVWRFFPLRRSRSLFRAWKPNASTKDNYGHTDDSQTVRRSSSSVKTSMKPQKRRMTKFYTGVYRQLVKKNSKHKT